MEMVERRGGTVTLSVCDAHASRYMYPLSMGPNVQDACGGRPMLEGGSWSWSFRWRGAAAHNRRAGEGFYSLHSCLPGSQGKWWIADLSGRLSVQDFRVSPGADTG